MLGQTFREESKKTVDCNSIMIQLKIWPIEAIVKPIGAREGTRAEAVARDLAQQNLLYVEAFYSPADFAAQGLEVGRSLVEDEMIETAREVLAAGGARGVALELPTDVVVTDAVRPASDAG